MTTLGYNQATDVSLQATIAQENAGAPYTGFSAVLQAGVMYRVITNIVHEYAASASQLSSWYWDDGYNEIGVDTIAPGGYDTILNAIFANQATGAVVVLGTNVTGVTYSACAAGGGVSVAANGPSGPVTFRARAVGVTVPLGVLKAKVVTFTPARWTRLSSTSRTRPTTPTPPCFPRPPRRSLCLTAGAPPPRTSCGQST